MIFDGAGAGSTRLGSRVREQVSVLKSVAFSVRFCAVRAFFSPYFMMRLEQTCLDMIFRRGGWGLDSAWLKGSGTGFGFEIRCIFGPFLRCSRLFFSLFHDETRTNMFGHDFSTGRVLARLGLAQGFGNRFRF